MLHLADLLRVPQVDTGLQFDISPDGRSVAFSWNKSGNWEIYTMVWRAKRSNLLASTTGGEGAKFSPRYSPDGKQLAYALDPDGSESYHIILQNLETTSQTDLTPDCAYAHQPNFAFSPDGKALAMLTDEKGQFALYLLSIQTRERKLLLDLHRPRNRHRRSRTRKTSPVKSRGIRRPISERCDTASSPVLAPTGTVTRAAR